MTQTTIAIIAVAACGVARTGLAQTPPDPSPSSSLMVTTPVVVDESPTAQPPHALRSFSLFAIAPPEPRSFQIHDLVQIIVRETSRAKSKHELETDKQYELDGKVPHWTNLVDLWDLRATTDDHPETPRWNVNFTKEFDGEGDYKREDDLTARLTAEVIEVQPNGNLVLEARTVIKTDEEVQTIKLTGICRPEDVSPANTILSNQVHDLNIEKVHSGELRKTAEKGIIAKVLDAVFAF